MEDRFIEENVRHRLILSGISELEEQGIAGFSLRRAALGAQVSCAAPYRHFKDKEEYISEIIAYVGSKWELLHKEIAEIFKDDPSSLVIETCIANLRFRIANRNLPLAIAHAKPSGNGIDASIERVVFEYCKAKSLLESDAELLAFTALSIIYGAVSMENDENSEKIFELTRKALSEKFK